MSAEVTAITKDQQHKGSRHFAGERAAIHSSNKMSEQVSKVQRKSYVIPNMLRRPILSIRRAETMFPGSTASVPRKLTK